MPYLVENLKIACATQRSISQLCRAININRQQFNRYINGQTRPSAHNLARIANYFDLDTADFGLAPKHFRERLRKPILGLDESSELLKGFPGNLTALRRHIGYFQTYHRSPSWPGMVVCSCSRLIEQRGAGTCQVNGTSAGPWKRHPAVFEICGLGGLLSEPDLHYGACRRPELHVVPDDPPAFRSVPARLFARNNNGNFLAKGKPPLCLTDDLALCGRRARLTRTSCALWPFAINVAPPTTDGALIPRGSGCRSICYASRVLSI